MRDALAIAVARSSNEKIGDSATTYAAQASCPSSCVFFNGGGCYAENGRLYSSTTQHLNEAAASASATALEVAKAEADAISHLPVLQCYDRPLRLHTVGDCRTDETARIVAAAAAEYMRRGGGPVWTYTHAWRTVDRASWGCVSVLASCETPEQVELARARGYATSMVVEEFRSRRLHDTREDTDGDRADDRPVARGDRRGAPLDRERHRSGRRGDPDPRRQPRERDVEARGGEGRARAAGGADELTCRTARPGASPGIAASEPLLRPGALKGQRPGSGGAPVTSAAILPCPAQTTAGVTCSSCRLCMDDTRLRGAGYSIGFAVHGTALSTKKAVESLRRASDPTRRLTSRDHARAYLAEHGELPRPSVLARLAGIHRSSASQMLDRLRDDEAVA